jgi:ribosomal protein S18 acetylase RimI-like enzyme
MHAELTIRAMQKGDLAFASECTAAEGWVSENAITLEGFFLHDPGGCLLAEENGKPVGMVVSTDYGNCGFIGELIVTPAARGRGVGAALLNHAVGMLKHRGVETVYLDGVVKAVDLYERNGFHKVCRSWRFSGNLAGKDSPHVRRMVKSDLEQVVALDERSFGAHRGFFLRYRLECYPEQGYVAERNGRVVGFILGRGGQDWLSAGPWVVEEWVNHPMELLFAFALESGGRTVNLGILDTNHQAIQQVQSLGFVARADSPWRMALGSSQDLGTSPYCFAIGSAAKG